MPTSLVPLGKFLQAANVLAGQSKPNAELIKKSNAEKPELSDVLAQRLASIADDISEALALRDTRPSRWEDLGEAGLKAWTGRYALAFLQELHKHEVHESEKQASASSAAGTSNAAQQPPPPLFGIRDIKTIQILASLVARWNIALLLDQGILPSEMQERVPALQVIDQEESERAEALQATIQECTVLLLWKSQLGFRGEIQSAVLPHLLLPTLAALLQLEHTGSKTSATSVDILDSVNPSTAMAALLTLLSSKKAGRGDIKPAWVNPAVSSLLSKQIARPGGILGILNVMLGRTDQELQFAQLEQIAKLIITPPKGTSAEDHISIVLPKILGILRPPVSGNAPPPSFMRALCFCISTLLSTAPEHLKDHLHTTFSLQGDDIEAQIELLSVIVGNIDPSHTVYSFLLSPVIVKLFSMYFYIVETRGDPVLKEAVETLISVWARAMSVSELVQGMSRVVDEGPAYRWQRSDTGGVQSAEHDDTGNCERVDAVIRPDPDLVVDWLRKHDRSQVTTTLLVHWLDQVNVLRQEPDQDGNLRLQKMIILRLQLILKIIEECGSDIVKEAQQTLQFINLALDDSAGQDQRQKAKSRGAPVQRPKSASGLSLSDLRIADEDDDDEPADAEDLEDEPEFPELLGIAPGEQLQVTGLTLLLAVLEGHEDLTTENTTVLRSINKKLSKLVEAETDTTARLAKDAQFILSLRSASAHSASSATEDVNDTLQASRATYQEALKLLQDPILPVRAQGLSMLRSLVDSKDALLTTDTALIPAILDIFVHAVQDTDSFIYLNAVQGLSGMVDQFGKNISRRLAALYTGSDATSVGEGDKGLIELDKRLRIGEAIIQVIQRAEKALPVYVDAIVPPMLHTIRSASLPVALRSSAISILSACAESSPLALLSFRQSLVDGMLDLLSLESRQSAQSKPKDETPDPLEIAATHPSLRRGAVVLLGLLLRAMPERFTTRELARMKAVLGYLKQVDEDPLVRHNAGEVLEDCVELMSL